MIFTTEEIEELQKSPEAYTALATWHEGEAATCEVEYWSKLHILRAQALRELCQKLTKDHMYQFAPETPHRIVGESDEGYELKSATELDKAIATIKRLRPGSAVRVEPRMTPHSGDFLQMIDDLNEKILSSSRLPVPSKTPPMPIVATPVEDNTPQNFRFALMLKSITPKD